LPPLPNTHFSLYSFLFSLILTGADEVLLRLRFVWISHMHADHHVGLVRVLARRAELLRRQGQNDAHTAAVSAAAATEDADAKSVISHAQPDVIVLAPVNMGRWLSD
jgi:ribonuclease Z